jgi:hypothetical protein
MWVIREIRKNSIYGDCSSGHFTSTYVIIMEGRRLIIVYSADRMSPGCRNISNALTAEVQLHVSHIFGNFPSCTLLFESY